MNLAVALPAELDDAAPIVESALIEELQRRSVRVATIWPPDARALWAASVARVPHTGNASRDLRAASEMFAELLRESAHYDLLLFPSLVLREARVSGRNAKWDGVRRRIEIRTPEPDGTARNASDAPLFETTGVAGSPEWTGKISGLSLHLLGYRADRRRPLERWAGLDLVHDAVPVRDPGSRSQLEMRPQANLLDDSENLREGIDLALEGLGARP
jgi:hypothetical protein